MQFDDHIFMRVALSLAERGRGAVSPNPMVGCVLVRQRQIIASGWHAMFGGPHAEVVALNQLSEALDLSDCTLYVTLEPCAHQGKTPPCVDAIIAAGIRRVVVAIHDPHPLVSGRGIARLREQGVTVTVGISAAAAQTLNQYYCYAQQYHAPYVIAKWALSLDGKTVANQAHDRRFSCLETQAKMHALRQQVDAIVIGAGTLVADNPQLTARHPEHQTPLPHQQQPWRVVVSARLAFDTQYQLFQDALAHKTLIICPDGVAEEKLKPFLACGVGVLRVVSDVDGVIAPATITAALYTHGCQSVLLEGGMRFLTPWFASTLIDEYRVEVAPFIVGDLPQKQALSVCPETIAGHTYITGTAQRGGRYV